MLSGWPQARVSIALHHVLHMGAKVLWELSDRTEHCLVALTSSMEFLICLTEGFLQC